jgi:hypothetical protein
VLLQYRFFDEVDWPTQLVVEHVTLVFVPVVIADRAESASASIESAAVDDRELHGDSDVDSARLPHAPSRRHRA